MTGWNKARLKRLIEDERYLGSDTYPPIIEKDAFKLAQELKAAKNTQKAIDRTADIFQMTIPVLCGECGQPMRRMHDGRSSYGEKWVCRSCKATVKLSDTDFLKAITDSLNLAITTPQLADILPRQAEPSMAALRLENEISRLLDSRSIDKETLKSRIFEYASQMYAGLDDTKCITQTLKAVFEKSRPLSIFNRELTERTVSAITLYTDKSVGLTLKNGQRIRKEQPNATDSDHPAEAGAHNCADHTAGSKPKHHTYPQACGGVLPCVNQ